jgi:AcrR family transcriptional regulator
MAGTKGARSTGTRRRADDLATRIVDTALDIAEEHGWTAVRLVDVADRLNIPPGDILRYYRDVNSVADAWFLRGWEAMLARKPADFARWPAAERIEFCLLAWFDQMATHRQVTVEMLRGKLHLPHPHHWVPIVFDLSRTIHWLREAAALPAIYGTRRANMEEVGLTWLFLATLAVWASDETPGQQRTRRFLRHRLAEADRLMTSVWGAGERSDSPGTR